MLLYSHKDSIALDFIGMQEHSTPPVAAKKTRVWRLREHLCGEVDREAGIGGNIRVVRLVHMLERDHGRVVRLTIKQGRPHFHRLAHHVIILWEDDLSVFILDAARSAHLAGRAGPTTTTAAARRTSILAFRPLIPRPKRCMYQARFPERPRASNAFECDACSMRCMFGRR